MCVPPYTPTNYYCLKCRWQEGDPDLPEPVVVNKIVKCPKCQGPLASRIDPCGPPLNPNKVY